MSATPTGVAAIDSLTPVKDDSNRYSCNRSPKYDASPNRFNSDVHQDSDEDVQKSFQNPEPPKELVEQNLINADNIGDTVFSKHWLFTTLMDLLKVFCLVFYW